MYRYTPEALEEAEHHPGVLTDSVSAQVDWDTYSSQDREVRREARKTLVQSRATLRAGATLVDKRELLRVKLKSLMEEARIIRREEQRTWGAFRSELRSHRTMDLRREARHAHLAYGLIRGLSIEDMEYDAYWRTYPSMYVGQWDMIAPSWVDVERLIKKYGSEADVAGFRAMFEKTRLKPGDDHRIKERPVGKRPAPVPDPEPPKKTVEQKQEEAVQATAAKLDPAASWPFPIEPRKVTVE